MSTENFKYMLATFSILLLGGIFSLYHFQDEVMDFISPATEKPVHVHADFAFYLLGNRVDLTDASHQSSVESIKHKYIHFHDGVDTMIHRHKEGITLGTFLESIGIKLSSTCVTLTAGSQHCTDSSNSLILFVNGTAVPEPSNYIPQEEDRILLFFGDPRSPQIASLQAEVTDEACIYSGTCPERGEPPFETCGITCEI